MAKPLKICIVGPGCGPRAIGNYDNTWTFWGINAAYRKVQTRWGLMFNLHRLAHLERDCPEYIDWDAAFSRRNPNVPMVVVDSWGKLLKNQRLFPYAELARQPRGRYHASSFDLLVAYATHFKAQHLHLHGAHFAVDGPGEEPISARACLEYWCGYAQGQGIKVEAFNSTGLFRQFHLVMSDTVYGWDDVHMIERHSRKQIR